MLSQELKWDSMDLYAMKNVYTFVSIMVDGIVTCGNICIVPFSGIVTSGCIVILKMYLTTKVYGNCFRENRDKVVDIEYYLKTFDDH